MIECIFTIDYEIFGNGEGSLKELVYEPAEKLKQIFWKSNARFVIFADVAELEMIEVAGADPAAGLVKNQLRDFCKDGFELGLHFHPWWYNSRYENGRWQLDYSEYNLCTLPQERIVQIVDRSVAYLRKILGVDDFAPLSFRAGHLLFQPTRTLARVLSERGIKVDSSVYKGGLHKQYGVDYRGALKNGYYWKFTDSANEPDPKGVLLELPIYAQMVWTWEVFTRKRIEAQRRGSSLSQKARKILSRLKDFLHFSHAMKLDICHMTPKEILGVVDKIINEDKEAPKILRPVVLIGHTKELVDFETIEFLLSYLKQRGIRATTFEEVYPKCECWV